MRRSFPNQPDSAVAPLGRPYVDPGRDVTSSRSWSKIGRMSSEEASCPLCGCRPAPLVHRDRARDYFRCPQCTLMFVPPTAYLDAMAERARYDLHQNHPDDIGYRNYLAPLAAAVIHETTPGDRGLDFGCGPGPVLATMLRDADRSVDLYDPFYAPDESIWSRDYDFITASEVFEHLHHPRRELERLFRILRPGGLLAVMTQFVPPPEQWPKWHYFQDLTHVGFYCRETFEFIGSEFQADLEVAGNSLAMLRKEVAG